MAKNLSKEDLISLLSENLQLPKESAEAAIDQVVNKIGEYLAEFKEVILNGFGPPITVKQKSVPGLEKQSDPSQTLVSNTEAPLSSNEQRKLKRRNFILDIEIQDQSTGETIGDLGDITAEGIMIVSETPISEKKVFSFLIKLPREADEELSIKFEARSIRCQETVHENIYITGFRIESLDEENKHKIEYLIREYAV